MKTIMKIVSKTLALLLALLMAFGISAGAMELELFPDALAAFAPQALPGDLGALPALTLDTETAGTLTLEDADYGFVQGEAWYQFAPTQGGCFLVRLTDTGGYYNSYDDYVSVFMPQLCDAAGAELSMPYRLEQGETCYVRVYSSGRGVSSVTFAVTPRLYEYVEILPLQKSPSSSLETILEGTQYTVGDVEYVYTRKTGSKEYRDIYFSDGKYTTVEIGSFSLGDIFQVDGIFGVVKQIVGWLAIVPVLPFLGIALSFFFSIFSTGLTLITLLPASILLIPVALLFLPFSLLSLLLNLF